MQQHRAPYLDGVLIALVAAAAYLWLAQTTIYGDGFQFCVWVTSGQLFHPVHYFYLPLLHLVRICAEAVGAGFYPAACALSAAGAATGVLFTHFGSRELELSRRDCALTTALVACAPSLAFFATVVEVHAVFFTLAGLAFWSVARLTRRRDSASALAFGIATGVSFMVHASGIALPIAFGLWFLADARTRRARIGEAMLLLLVAGLVHGVVVFGAMKVVPLLSNAEGANAAGFWALFPWHSLDEVPITIWYEWFWAFMPCSLAFLVGFFRDGQRLHAAVLAITLVPYLVVAFKLVPAANEHGAYLVPLAIPAALITVRCLPSIAVFALICVSAATAWSVIDHHDKPEPSRALAAAITEAAGNSDVILFAANQHDMEACMSHLPGSKMVWLGELLLVPAEGVPSMLAAIENAMREAGEDRAVVVPRSVDQILALVAETHPAARPLADFFEHGCRSEPIEAAGFSGRRVRLR